MPLDGVAPREALATSWTLEKPGIGDRTVMARNRRHDFRRINTADIRERPVWHSIIGGGGWGHVRHEYQIGVSPDRGLGLLGRWQFFAIRVALPMRMVLRCYARGYLGAILREVWSANVACPLPGSCYSDTVRAFLKPSPKLEQHMTNIVSAFGALTLIFVARICRLCSSRTLLQ